MANITKCYRYILYRDIWGKTFFNGLGVHHLYNTLLDIIHFLDIQCLLYNKTRFILPLSYFFFPGQWKRLQVLELQFALHLTLNL